MPNPLTAPFPYFGGKRLAVDLFGTRRVSFFGGING